LNWLVATSAKRRRASKRTSAGSVAIVLSPALLLSSAVEVRNSHIRASSRQALRDAFDNSTTSSSYKCDPSLERELEFSFHNLTLSHMKF
jgi:hypothetical protein